MSEPRPTENRTEQDVDALLETLKTLRQEVANARSTQASSEAELELAHREYQDRIRPILREIGRIQGDINDLLQRIEGDALPAQREEPIDGAGGQAGSGREDGGQTTTTSARDSRQTKDPEAIAKDILIEHAYRVLDPMVNAADAEQIGQLQGLVSDPAVKLGDILATLEWGAIWEAKALQETVGDQYGRLSTWKRALENQLALLSKGQEQRRKDRRYGLWEQRQKGPEAWGRFLDQAVAEYERERDGLNVHLQELRAEWRRMIER